MALGFIEILILLLLVLALFAPRLGRAIRESNRARSVAGLIVLALTGLVCVAVFSPGFGGAGTSSKGMTGGFPGGSECNISLEVKSGATWHLRVGVLTIWVAFWLLAGALVLRRVRLLLVIGVVALMGFGTWGVTHPPRRAATLTWNLTPGKVALPDHIVMPADIGWQRAWSTLEHVASVQNAMVAAQPVLGTNTASIETSWVDDGTMTDEAKDEVFHDLAVYTQGIDAIAALAAERPGQEGWRKPLLRSWLEYLKDLEGQPHYTGLRALMLELGSEITKEAGAIDDR